MQKLIFNQQNKNMLNLFENIKKIAKYNVHCMITGETGTGKTLIAKYLHFLSPRKDQAFLDINCGGIPDTLLESELFGYSKGAFTDAKQTRKGLIRSADKGTIFLDEIGNMPISIQSKLLKFLDTKKIQPLGSDNFHEVDVRIISATNTDLKNAIKNQKFRLDLYHRLKVIKLETVPLRENKLDINLLCQHYLDQINKELETNIKYIDNDVFEVFQNFKWTGNVRELCNVLYNSVILHKKDDDELHLEDLPKYILKNLDKIDLNKQKEETKKEIVSINKQEEKILDEIKNIEKYEDLTYQNFKFEFEKDFFKNSLIKYDGNVTLTAKKLAVNRATVIQKVKKYDLYEFVNKKKSRIKKVEK